MTRPLSFFLPLVFRAQKNPPKRVFDGAADQANLEPATLASVLDNLEEWERYLKAEPELMHKLRGFEDAADGREDKPSGAPVRPARLRGPSL